MSTLTRRQFLHFIVAIGISSKLRAENKPIRIGITPVFLTELTSVLRDWKAYLEFKIGQPIVFVQRDTYRGIVNNLLTERLDFAWICGYPYTAHRQKLRLTAVPIYKGKPLYQAYLIVPKRDTSTRSILDLKGHVFAYTDPDSNSGFLVPKYQLLMANQDPNTFFRKTFISAGHHNAIEAVSTGLANGAYVDGYVWDSMTRFRPDITDQTRVVSKSSSFGFPPIVAGPSVSPEILHRLQNTLKNMHEDPSALSILNRLNIDGFGAGQPSDYETINKMAAALGNLRNDP